MSDLAYTPSPRVAQIGSIIRESASTHTLVLVLQSPAPELDAARPGQFIVVSVFGHGEAAFVLSSLPGPGSLPGTVGCVPGSVVVTVRRAGDLSAALLDLPVGATVGVRGPYGCGFPRSDLAQPTIYVAGGCGLAALKAAIDLHIATRPFATDIAVVYGARTPDARVLRSALEAWSYAENVLVLECVEEADDAWQGRRGTVVDHLPDALARARPTRAAISGPAAMLRPIAETLIRAGIDASQVHLAVEHSMECATGAGGHDDLNHRRLCTDGPVFSYAELRGRPDAFGPPPGPSTALAR